jgi:PadR family transcriptional regulator, regulatory protein PadR
VSDDAQMLKGVLSLLLLRLIKEREDYGYALMVRLQDAGFTDLTGGTVYPALSRMESGGLLESRLRSSTSGPARKYYRLTPAGEGELVRTLAAWTTLTENVDRALQTTRSPA